MRAQGPNAQCVCVCTVTPNVVLANHENTINLCMLIHIEAKYNALKITKII